MRRYDIVSAAFSGKNNIEVDQPYNKIMLSIDSTNIEVSDYIQQVGDIQEDGAYPFKVMNDSKGTNDKWITNNKTGWIVYQFDKPIVIRAYGLMPVSDHDPSAPYEWEFYIQDAIKKLTEKDIQEGNTEPEEAWE
jgi:hypothetical protein